MPFGVVREQARNTEILPTLPTRLDQYVRTLAVTKRAELHTGASVPFSFVKSRR